MSVAGSTAQTEPWAQLLCAAAALAAVLVFKRAKARRIPEAPEISSRGSKLLKPTLPYVEVLFKALANKYSVDNPSGCVPMLVAENNLSFDILRPAMVQFQDFSDEMGNYANPSGIPALKAALANVLSRHVTKHPVSTDQIVVSAGLTAVLNHLFYAMCEEGDAVLIPTPYYSAFDFDVRSVPLNVRAVGASLERVAHRTASNISALARTVPVEVRTAHPEYEITDEVMDDAARRAIAAGHTPRVLLLTSPSNPLGMTYTAEQLRRISSWCKRNNIHLVSDEIYALSTYDESRPFISVAEVLDNKLGSHVHILWALSKDFCMSGARCGVLYTQNEQLLRAVSSLCMVSQIPTAHQEILAHMLQDEQLVERFLKENKRRLAVAARRVREGLTQLGIPVLPSNAGLFVWADFRRVLRAPTFEAEMELFVELYEAGVALTPGGSQHAQEPGFFRICFAWATPDALEVAISRLEDFLARRQLL